MKRKKAFARVCGLAIAMVAAGLAPLTAASTATAITDFSTTGEQANVSFNTWTPDAAGFYDPDESPTASKPQSKLWYAQNTWWGVLLDKSNTFHIWKFDAATRRWSDTGTVVDTRQRSRIDVLWDAAHVYMVGAVQNKTTTSADAIKFSRFTYDGSKYVLDAGFPKALNAGGVEAAVLSKDGHGRLWVAYTAAGNSGTTPVKNVRYVSSDNQGATWTAPQALPFPESTNLNNDDIADVVGSSDGASIAWSRQDATNATSNEAFYVAKFSWTTGQWSLDTLISKQYAADDHLNMSVDGDGAGRVFMVVKTGANDQPSAPSGGALLELWVRGLDGSWTSHTVNTVGEGGTRPIVAIDKDANLLRVFYTDKEVGGSVYEKTTSLTNPGTFTSGRPVISVSSDPNINNVTSTKQNVTPGTPMLLLASDQRTGNYVQNFSGGGGTPTPTPTPRTSGPTVGMTAPGAYYGGSRMVTARWTATADHYRLTRSVIGTGPGARWRTTAMFTRKAGVSFEGTPGNTYCMQVRGFSASGVAGKLSAVRCVAVPLDDRQLAQRGAWQRVTAKRAYLGTLLRTTSRGASLTRTVTAKNVALVVTALPRGGKVYVFQGKRLVKRISLNAKRLRSRLYVPIANNRGVVTAKYRVVVVSRNRAVIIDGLAVSRK